MLLRPLFALLLSLLVAGLPLAGQATQAGHHASQACMQQQDASPADCSGDNMATAACAAQCATGACIGAAVTAPQLTFVSVRPNAHEAVGTPECRAAPDTAPPKVLLP